MTLFIGSMATLLKKSGIVTALLVGNSSVRTENVDWLNLSLKKSWIIIASGRPNLRIDTNCSLAETQLDRKKCTATIEHTEGFSELNKTVHWHHGLKMLHEKKPRIFWASGG